MRDMIEWLRVTLDAVEQEANACIAEVGKTRSGEPYQDGSGVADRDDFPSYPWGSQEHELAFMAGPGHPESVLRQVRAHRAILDLHEGADGYCNECAGTMLGRPAPCATLRLLGACYSDRDGFREEWAA